MSPEIPPDTAALIRSLTVAPDHAHFVGGPIDLEGVDPLALGDVWAIAEVIDRQERYREQRSAAGRMAEAVLARASETVPLFRGFACCDYLDRLVAVAEGADRRSRAEVEHLRTRASFALARCPDLASGELAASAERILALCPWVEIPHLAVTLSRLAGPERATQVLDVLAAELATSPFLLDELRLAAELPLREIALLADVADTEWVRPVPARAGLRHRLSDCPGYVGLSAVLLRRAAERVETIHRGEVPYAADKAFTPSDAKVLGRALRVALDRDEPWIPPVLESLVLKVCVAPTAARTMPSQSVAVALGHAVESYPTAEAVALLRRAVNVIRHAGVAKKLQRNLRGAEKALAGRMSALRLPSDRPATRAQLTTLKRALEASVAAPRPLPFARWCAQLWNQPGARGIAGSLIWRIVGGATDGVAVLPVAGRNDAGFAAIDGRPVTVETDSSLILWHPADASADERLAWRDRIVAQRVKQPFKQAFREHYAIPEADLATNETDMFAGHAVSLRPFLGLARREGWRADGGNGITRPLGPWTVALSLADEVHPGATGWTTVGALGLWKEGELRWAPVPFTRLTAVVLSELLRTVDLVVSTSAFAVTVEPGPGGEEPFRRKHLERLGERPLGPMAEMRRQAIERALAGTPGLEDLRFDPRHLRLGAYAIHLATGRVTRDGDSVTVTLPQRPRLAAVPWLPYDEKLLEHIVHTVLEIAGRSDPR